MLKTHVLMLLMVYFLALSDHSDHHDHPVHDDTSKIKVCKGRVGLLV